MTTVTSAPSASAETRTRLAPTSMCFAASARLVNFPAHSSATWTPRLRQGSCTGSHSALDRDPAAADIDPIVPGSDLTGDMPVNAVVLQEMCIVCDRAEVIDCDNLDVLAAGLMQSAQDQPAAAPKIFDGYSYRRVSPPIEVRLRPRLC